MNNTPEEMKARILQILKAEQQSLELAGCGEAAGYMEHAIQLVQDA